MIIKLLANETECSWRFIDGVRDFQHASVPSSSAPQCDDAPHEEGCGVIVEDNDGIVRETLFVRAVIPKMCTLLTFRDHADKYRHVCTDADIYLLNDAGKTIECIR